MDSFSEDNRNDSMKLEDSVWCTGSSLCAFGQCFWAPLDHDYMVCKAKFFLMRKGNLPSDSNYIYVGIYDTTGTCGYDCTPDDWELLAVSDNFGANSVSQVAFTLYEFTFTKKHCLEKGHCYAVVLHASGPNFDTSNYIMVGINKSIDGEPHSGNGVYWRDSNWGHEIRVDTIFYVYGCEDYCLCEDCGGGGAGGTGASAGVGAGEGAGEGGAVWRCSKGFHWNPWTARCERNFKQYEHRGLYLIAPITTPYAETVNMKSKIGVKFGETLLHLKSPVGLRVFFETKASSKVGKPYVKPVHLMGTLGVPYEETLCIKENIRNLIESANTNKILLDNYMETFSNFVETVIKKQTKLEEDLNNLIDATSFHKEEIKKLIETKDEKTKEVLNNYLETLGAFIEKLSKRKNELV